MYLAYTCVYNLSQSRDTTNAQFLEKFMTCLSIIEPYGDSNGMDKGTVEDEVIMAVYAIPSSVGEKQTASDKVRPSTSF
jgi:hypothetical protein